MEKTKFKTNINCGGCIDKVSPVLQQIAGLTHWNVDTQDKNKILTIEGNAEVKSIVVDKIKSLGFNIELL